MAALSALSVTADESIVSGPLVARKLSKNEFSLYIVVVEFKIIVAFFAAFPDFASSSAFRRISSSELEIKLCVLEPGSESSESGSRGSFPMSDM